MDTDIQFGEVEEARPQPRRRPDRDRHFAVSVYGTPAGVDLPVFVDMDVLADMEAHARSDTRVELGGVLLGGQFQDEEGRPFVVVLDSLRAQHYESSSGHFKFTHDTWSEFTRQRDAFSDDLQMVGWYHTHPGWGVFLSGMDRFICDHFFNRPLDVALVIDPVRGDRGWFYWSREALKQSAHAGGFSVIASRFRRRELQTYVEQLEGFAIMKPEGDIEGVPVGAGSRIPQQVIHTIRPQLGWIGVAILALLVLQLVITLLIAFRSGAPTSADLQAAFVARSDQDEREARLDRRETRLAAREAAFEKILGHVKVGPDGKIDVASLVDENRDLRRELDRLRKTDLVLGELTVRFQHIDKERKELAANIKNLQGDLEKLTASRDEERKAAQKEIADLKGQLAKAESKKAEIPKPVDDGTTATVSDSSRTPDEVTDPGLSKWTVAVLVVVGMLAIGAGVVVIRKGMHPR